MGEAVAQEPIDVEYAILGGDSLGARFYTGERYRK